MNYKKSYFFYEMGIFLGLPLSMIGLILPVLWLAILGLVIFTAGILQTIVFYRCPYCGKNLDPRRANATKFCPECGKKLEEEK